MGLDGVELIMAIEEEFDISIPDPVEGRIETAGDLCELVVRLRRENPSASALESTDENVWKTVKEIIVDRLRVDPDKVTRKTRFIEDLGVD